jgi:hypothetical protein
MPSITYFLPTKTILLTVLIHISLSASSLPTRLIINHILSNNSSIFISELNLRENTFSDSLGEYEAYHIALEAIDYYNSNQFSECISLLDAGIVRLMTDKTRIKYLPHYLNYKGLIHKHLGNYLIAEKAYLLAHKISQLSNDLSISQILRSGDT